MEKIVLRWFSIIVSGRDTCRIKILLKGGINTLVYLKSPRKFTIYHWNMSLCRLHGGRLDIYLGKYPSPKTIYFISFQTQIHFQYRLAMLCVSHLDKLSAFIKEILQGQDTK